MSRIVYPTLWLRGTRWKIVVINDDQREKAIEKEKEIHTHTYTKREKTVLGATTASVAPLRGPQNDSTRYAYCMVILPVYLLQYLFTVVITRFYYHPAPFISRRIEVPRASLLQTGRCGSWLAAVIRVRYIIRRKS